MSIGNHEFPWDLSKKILVYTQDATTILNFLLTRKKYAKYIGVICYMCMDNRQDAKKCCCKEVYRYDVVLDNDFDFDMIRNNCNLFLCDKCRSWTTTEQCITCNLWCCLDSIVIMKCSSCSATMCGNVRCYEYCEYCDEPHCIQCASECLNKLRCEFCQNSMDEDQDNSTDGLCDWCHSSESEQDDEHYDDNDETDSFNDESS